MQHAAKQVLREIMLKGPLRARFARSVGFRACPVQLSESKDGKRDCTTQQAACVDALQQLDPKRAGAKSAHRISQIQLS